MVQGKGRAGARVTGRGVRGRRRGKPDPVVALPGAPAACTATLRPELPRRGFARPISDPFRVRPVEEAVDRDQGGQQGPEGQAGHPLCLGRRLCRSLSTGGTGEGKFLPGACPPREQRPFVPWDSPSALRPSERGHWRSLTHEKGSVVTCPRSHSREVGGLPYYQHPPRPLICLLGISA